MEQFIKLSSFDKTLNKFTSKYFNTRAIRAFDQRTNLVLLDGCLKPMMVEKESMNELVKLAEEGHPIANELNAIRTMLFNINVKLENLANKKFSIF